MSNNNNPYGSKSHLRGIDFETVRQFIQCDINLRNGVNINTDGTLSSSELGFLANRGLDPYDAANVKEYIRLRSLVLHDIEQKETSVDVTKRKFTKDEKTFGRNTIIRDGYNNDWLLHGFLGKPILSAYEAIPYNAFIVRHKKALDILTGSEYNLLTNGDPLEMDIDTVKKYINAIKKVIKAGVYDDEKDTNDEFVESTDENITVWVVREDVSKRTPFGSISEEVLKYKAFDKEGNEVDDYPLPTTQIVEVDHINGIAKDLYMRTYPYMPNYHPKNKAGKNTLDEIFSKAGKNILDDIFEDASDTSDHKEDISNLLPPTTESEEK
jgi:hypothetical protein